MSKNSDVDSSPQAKKLPLIVTRILEKERSEPDPYVLTYMEENPKKYPVVWYIILNMCGLMNQICGGEFLGQLEMSPTGGKYFPLSPPYFHVCTPNGTFEDNKQPCVSIGQYHSNNSQPMLGISGFIREIANGMAFSDYLGGGINVTKTTLEEKKKFAANSRAYNRAHHSGLLRKIYADWWVYSRRLWVADSQEPTTTRTKSPVDRITSILCYFKTNAGNEELSEVREIYPGWIQYSEFYVDMQNLGVVEDLQKTDYPMPAPAV